MTDLPAAVPPTPLSPRRTVGCACGHEEGEHFHGCLHGWDAVGFRSGHGCRCNNPEFADAARAATPAASDRELRETLRMILGYFEEAMDYIAEHPADDDRLTAYMRRAEQAHAVLDR